MIANPSQWQIDTMKIGKDDIIFNKKPFYVYIIDFINRYKPIYVKIPIVDDSGNIIDFKEVDNRFVAIFPEKEKLSRVTKALKVAYLDEHNNLDSYNGSVSVSPDSASISFSGRTVTVSLNELEVTISKMKRKYDLVKNQFEIPNYKLVSTQIFGEIEYDNIRYRFKNGIELQFLFYVDESSKNKKFHAIESMFKLHCSGDTIEEAHKNILKILVDRIKLALNEPSDKEFINIMLNNSESEFLKDYVEIEKIE